MVRGHSSEARCAGGRRPEGVRRLQEALVPIGWSSGGPHLWLPQHVWAPGEQLALGLGMIFPVARYSLRWLHRSGGRTLPPSAMEVALRGVRKVLCVAEKNDAAKGIADLLSNGRMRRVRRHISDQLCLERST